MKKMVGTAVVIMSIMSACQTKANDPDSEWKQTSDKFYQAMNSRKFRDARVMVLSDKRFADKPLADSRGALAMHMAASYADKSMVSLLLQQKVNVDARDEFSATPLGYAIRSHAEAQREVVLFLISKGADLSAKDNDGLTPMHYAAIEKNAAMINLLLSKKANINSKDKDGKTPLHWAVTAYKPSKTICQLLLSKGANRHAKDNDGDTPADLARMINSDILSEDAE